MKKQISSLLLFLSFFLIAFIPKDTGKIDESGFNIKEIDKSVVKITDSLYAGKYEVSNLYYHFWGFDIMKNNDTELKKNHLPDSLNWGDKSVYNEPLFEYYFRHPAYQDYPVVNISYEAAILFCEWLTKKYNSNPKRHFKKVLFRLPNEIEWETAASGGEVLSLYPWGNRLIKDNHNMCNYKIIGDELMKYDTLIKKIVIDTTRDTGVSGCLRDAADMPVPVHSYWPNKLGLYNVCGNIAEMVQEKGVSRGGGWRSLGGDVTIKSRGHYKKSSCDLGFRYFMEIIEK